MRRTVFLTAAICALLALIRLGDKSSDERSRLLAATNATAAPEPDDSDSQPS